LLGVRVAVVQAPQVKAEGFGLLLLTLLWHHLEVGGENVLPLGNHPPKLGQYVFSLFDCVNEWRGGLLKYYCGAA